MLQSYVSGLKSLSVRPSNGSPSNVVTKLSYAVEYELHLLVGLELRPFI